MNPWLRLARFYAVGFGGLMLQLTVVACAGHAGLDYRVSSVLALGVTLAHNFAWHARWTWSDRRPAGGRLVVAFWRFVTANGAVSFVGTVVLLPVVVQQFGVPPVPANLAVIGVCGLVNYWLGGRACFPQVSPAGDPSPTC
jgi:putative flippase GtrA